MLLPCYCYVTHMLPPCYYVTDSRKQKQGKHHSAPCFCKNLFIKYCCPLPVTTHFQLYSDSPSAASPSFLWAAGFLSPASCPLFSPLWGFSCAGIVLYASTVKRQEWGSIAPSITNFYNGFSPNPACMILPGFRPSALDIVSGSGSSPTVRIG